MRSCTTVASVNGWVSALKLYAEMIPNWSPVGQTPQKLVMSVPEGLNGARSVERMPRSSPKDFVNRCVGPAIDAAASSA